MPISPRRFEHIDVHPTRGVVAISLRGAPAEVVRIALLCPEGFGGTITMLDVVLDSRGKAGVVPDAHLCAMPAAALLGK